MHIVFEIDHRVPIGIENVIRRAMNDLALTAPNCSYETKVNSKLLNRQRDDVRIRTSSFRNIKLYTAIYASSIFSRSKVKSISKFYVTITVARLVYNYAVQHGLSEGRQSVVSLFNLSHLEYCFWSAGVWEVLMHEIGHMLGLVPASRINTTRKPSGHTHCINDCVMCTDSLKKHWTYKSHERYRNRNPYCGLCSRYIRKCIDKKMY